jgi:hypothetical protein
MIRRLRGILSLAMLWAVVWLLAGLVIEVGLRWNAGLLRYGIHFQDLSGWTGLGAFSGAVFAALIALFERRRTFDELSVKRLAIWGALAGAVLPVAASIALGFAKTDVSSAGLVAVLFVIMALLGGACGWSTIRLAKSGARVDIS